MRSTILPESELKAYTDSILDKTAFVKNEYVWNYERLPDFVNKNVPPPRRIPLCLISDSAPQIHSAVSKYYPYAVHCYCAFHLLGEEKIFSGYKNISEDEKNIIRDMVYTAILSHSLNDVENAISKIFKYAETAETQSAKDRMIYLAYQSYNGARPFHRMFTGNVVSSTRVETANFLSKLAGLSRKRTLFESILILHSETKRQHSIDLRPDRADWLFAKNPKFLKTLDMGGVVVSKEVLEKMYFGYLLSEIGMHKVERDASATTFRVTYMENFLKRAYDTYIVTLDRAQPQMLVWHKNGISLQTYVCGGSGISLTSK